MISNKFIFDSANQIISGSSLTDQQMTHISSIETLSNNAVLSVATLADLPEVVANIGSLVYVVAESKYYYSDGATWNVNYSTEFSVVDRGVYGWGAGSFGQVGDNTGITRSSPVSVVGGLNWSQVSGGTWNHSLALTVSGIAYAWGYNPTGQLGDNTVTSRLSPVTVVGGITNWSQVSAGGRHSLGLTSTGIAYAWGYNLYGRLGDGTTTSKRSPVIVVGGITNWSQLSGGADHSLGLTSDGIAYAWGLNANGRLGDGTTTSRLSPVTVVGGITNWSQLSGGNSHSLGLTSDGIAYAWGFNGSGQLGTGNTTSTSSPVIVVGGITNWSQVSAGWNHSLGLTDTGIAYAWGSGSNGLLGDGTTTAKSSPVTVIGGITSWSQVSAGQTHSLSLTSTGIAYAWGSNALGQLGDGTQTNQSSPVTVVGGITNWSQVSTGHSHSLGALIITKGF